MASGKGGHQQWQRWKTNEWKCHIASGKARTPAVTDLGDKWIEMLHGQQKRADTSSDRPGRQMNRNATWPAERADTSSDRPGRQMNRNATWSPKKGGHQQWPGRQMNRNATWPAEKGGHQQWQTWENKWIEMLHGQRKRADTSSDAKGGHILRKNWEPLTVNCLGKNLRKPKTT